MRIGHLSWLRKGHTVSVVDMNTCASLHATVKVLASKASSSSLLHPSSPNNLPTAGNLKICGALSAHLSQLNHMPLLVQCHLL